MNRFHVLTVLERNTARARGKGYGSRTVKQEVKLASKALNRRPQLAIDIGANIGEYTAELRRIDANLEIHAFEPSSKNVSILRERFSNDERIKIVPSAISDESGSATLFANAPGSVLGSLTKRRLEHFDIEFEHKEAIKTLRFDDYWRNELQGRAIDIVKLDIEGHELHALKGFGNAISSIGIIQFEFGGCNIDTRIFFRDFWYFFKDTGFDIYRIGPLGLEAISKYQESDECFLTTNFIARNKTESS